MKKIIFFGMFLVAAISVKAQFSHAGGATLFLVSADNTDATSAYGVSYFPRYSFGAISVGVPISAAITGSTNSRTGASAGSSFTYQLPLVVDYNFGLGASDDEESKFGGYAGLGYSLFSTSYVGVYTTGTLKANGPMARAGIRFLVKEHTLSLGASFLKGGGDLKANVIGVSLLYGF
ncbi:MAG: hypothetical protein QM541_02740 [Flavobacterium sp.]|nr:hypothetical protein [Flavobacterium sp.]